jgi:hypothetical protein
MAATENQRHQYSVRISNGDRAEADTLDGILLAGLTLVREARDLGGERKPTISLLRDGRCVLADVTPSIFASVGRRV